jgi:hypothetical protein
LVSRAAFEAGRTGTSFAVSMVAGTGNTIMANVRKGQLTKPPEWWRHLRRMKRVFWKRERKAAQRLIAREVR